MNHLAILIRNYNNNLTILNDLKISEIDKQDPIGKFAFAHPLLWQRHDLRPLIEVTLLSNYLSLSHTYNFIMRAYETGILVLLRLWRKWWRGKIDIAQG